MNRRGFFKTVLGGLALVLLPEVPEAKPEPSYDHMTHVREHNKFVKADFPSSHIAVWQGCNDLTMEVYYQENFTKEWRPLV